MQGELSWGSLGWAVYIKVVLIGFFFCYLFSEELDRILTLWVKDPSWSHGFLIPLFSLYFLNQHKKEILSLEPRCNYLGFFLMILGLVFYPLNIVQFQIGYFQPLTMIAVLGTIVLFLGGWRLVRYTWLPVLYLVFAVPLPSRLYVQFTTPMRQIASKAASVFLSFIPEMEATASGVVIDVVYKGVKIEPSLDVAEACSGMRLLMAFVALGVAMAYLHYRPIWQRLVLLVSTIPIAILCNIVRVTVTGLIYIKGNPKYAQGLWHDLLGMLMLPLAFGLYGFLAWFMSNLFQEESDEVEEIIIRRQR